MRMLSTESRFEMAVRKAAMMMYWRLNPDRKRKVAVSEMLQNVGQVNTVQGRRQMLHQINVCSCHRDYGKQLVHLYIIYDVKPLCLLEFDCTDADGLSSPDQCVQSFIPNSFAAPRKLTPLQCFSVHTDLMFLFMILHP